MKSKNFETFSEFRERRNQILEKEKTPPKGSGPDEEIWKKWRSLINMSASELQNFYDSEEGKSAGMKQKDANKAGIDSGRESARMLLKMIPTGGSFASAEKNWTPDMWRWARKQNSFNSRMLGGRKRIKGNPFEEEDGSMTRWLKSLLIWGHDPRKPKRKV
jgi:hypothetical protein